MNHTVMESNYARIQEFEFDTTFQGCQCHKDCSCAEGFKSSHMHFWNVYKNFGRHRKVRTFKNFEDAERCFHELNERATTCPPNKGDKLR